MYGWGQVLFPEHPLQFKIKSRPVISGGFNRDQSEVVTILLFACLGLVAGVGT